MGSEKSMKRQAQRSPLPESPLGEGLLPLAKLQEQLPSRERWAMPLDHTAWIAPQKPIAR